MKATTDTRAGDAAASYWRRLLHRWLVEYNPLYLLSATLVLGGMIAISRGLAHEGSALGEVGVAAIAEIYAATLIGGAALLTRIGHRRPAVMLALLTILYQWDLTLHTEACAYLGAVGAFATLVWLAVFVVKLRALAWAMKVDVSRATYGAAGLAGLGLAAFPYYLHGLDARAASALVAVWLFAIVSLHRAGAGAAVTSRAALEAWGRVVERRTTRAMSLLSGLLLSLHVAFWATQHRLALAPVIVTVVPLLFVRVARREGQVWAIVLVTSLIVALKMPESFAVTALLSAVALVLRALLSRRTPDPARPRDTTSPYRALSTELAPREPALETAAPITIDRAERMRLFTGALFALYVAVWTLGWSGGSWPAHVLALDLVVTAIAGVVLVWRARARVAIAPLVATYLHLALQMHLVPAPRGALGWGATAISLGFVLLVASLGASYGLRRPSS